MQGEKSFHVLCLLCAAVRTSSLGEISEFLVDTAGTVLDQITFIMEGIEAERTTLKSSMLKATRGKRCTAE